MVPPANLHSTTQWDYKTNGATSNQHRKKRVFSTLCLWNVLAKLKAIIQTQMPTFEETMMGQIATSGPGLSVVWVMNTRGFLFYSLGHCHYWTPPPSSIKSVYKSDVRQLASLTPTRATENIALFSTMHLGVIADGGAERKRVQKGSIRCQNKAIRLELQMLYSVLNRLIDLFKLFPMFPKMPSFSFEDVKYVLNLQ